jgi:hypothetical protein
LCVNTISFSCKVSRVILTSLVTDFLQVMKFIENHPKKDEYPYDRQCLIIFDRVLPATTNINFTTQSNLLENVIIAERSSVLWQLYVAKDLGRRDHFGCPTSNVIHLVQSLRTIRPKLSFTFIPERCPMYKNVFFRICSFMPVPNDELATYVTLLLKSSFPDFPTTSSSSKRGSAPAHSIGLQIQCAHQHHLSRFCQNNNTIPSVNLGSPFSVQAKKLFLHASLSLLEKEKQVFEMSFSPFVPESTNQTFIKSRSALKENLVSHLDPSGEALREHAPLNPIEFPDNSTLRFSKGLLGRHNDDLNGKGLDDNTLSLHAPTKIESLFNHDELLPGTQISKKLLKCGVSTGRLVPNLLLYTRHIATTYAASVRYRTEFLESETNCGLAKLVMRLLLTCRKPIDYQGYYFERAESFSNYANLMVDKSEHVSPGVTLNHFHTLASFDKMGFLSIVLHVFFSLHFHNFVKTEDDSISFCLYFGLFCNGTVQLVKVWQTILADRVAFAESVSLLNRDLFWIFERADLKVFLNSEEPGIADPTKWNDRTGNSQLPRFQFNTHGPAVIKKEMKHIRAAIKKILKYRQATPTLSNRNLHDMFTTELGKFKGVGPMRLNQLFSALCLTGLFPLRAMTDCIGISTSTNPGKLLSAFKKSSDRDLETTLEILLGSLKSRGFTRLTHFFLENMLCEMYRHLDAGTKSLLKDPKNKPANISSTILQKGMEMPEYLERLVNATRSPRSDVYFKDTQKDEWQHLFSIIDRKNIMQLEMRPSTAINTVKKTCNVKVHVTYDENNELVVECAPKQDFSLYFLK